MKSLFGILQLDWIYNNWQKSLHIIFATHVASDYTADNKRSMFVKDSSLLFFNVKHYGTLLFLWLRVWFLLSITPQVEAENRKFYPLQVT